MSNELNKMKMFELVDKHLKSGCQTCVKSLAFMLYHAQADKNVRNELHDFMREFKFDEYIGKESHEDFEKNVEEMNRSLDNFGKKN